MGMMEYEDGTFGDIGPLAGKLQELSETMAAAEQGDVASRLRATAIKALHVGAPSELERRREAILSAKSIEDRLAKLEHRMSELEPLVGMSIETLSPQQVAQVLKELERQPRKER